MASEEDPVVGSASNHSPLVSVVLPTFNGEKYLQSSIDSVLGQSYSNLELIIVNDASTDRTASIISRYTAGGDQEDARVRVLTNDQNQRVAASLNRGFANALGPLFTWTSDDNLFELHAIEVMVNTLLADPALSLVAANYHVIDEASVIVKTSKLPGPDTLGMINSVGACFLYRCELYERIGEYDVSRELVEDLDYWLRARSVARFRYLDEALYRYRRHPGALTSIRSADVARAHMRLLLDSVPLMNWLSEETLSQEAMGWANHCYRNGLRHETLQALRLTLWRDRFSRKAMKLCLYVLLGDGIRKVFMRMGR